MSTVTGQLTTLDGWPVAGGHAHSGRREWGAACPGRERSDGRIVLDGLPAGPYT